MNKYDLIIKVLSKLHPLENGCEVWTGAKCYNGYGKLDIKAYGFYKVTRFLMHHAGYNIKDKLVCHTCDNPSCCNLEHLFVGTNQDNTLDMYRKDRGQKYWRNKTHCKYGHKFTYKNTKYLFYKSRNVLSRICIKCRKKYQDEYNKKRKEFN